MNTRITFDFTKSQIILEGAEAELLKLIQSVKELAPKISEIRIVSDKQEALPHKETAVDSHSQQGIPEKSLRGFARSLPLNNLYERIGTIAFYVTEKEKRPYFTPKEMENWLLLCGFKKPSNIHVALSDCKRHYGFIQSKGRGEWTATAGASNLILERQGHG